MPPRTATFEKLQQHLEEITRVQGRSAAIRVADAEAARYASVLEYGSIAGQPPWPHPGPRTVLAVDPETGAHRVVSAQAPQGFVRVRVPQFLEALHTALARPADWLSADAVEAHLETALRTTAGAALEELRNAVPRDSGRLAESLSVTLEE